MSTFILLSAIPGSGKSTWAKEYQKTHENVVIVSSDEIRRKLFGSIKCFNDEPLVWKTYLEEINAHSGKGKTVTVIADATNLQNKYRRYYREMTPEFDKHILVYFNIPYDICLIQNQMRDPERVVPFEGMERLKEEMEEITPEIKALYDEYIELGPDFISQFVKRLKEEEKE